MLLQFAMVVMGCLAQEGSEAPKQTLEAHAEPGKPFLMPLRRESVPIKRQGKIASFKTSYSGLISVGSPARQEFRVVFDTGSGHVVLPSADCYSETCMAHRRYDMSQSYSAQLINADGTLVEEGEYADQATIGYGTGSVTGEFIQDSVCLGASERPATIIDEDWARRPCTDVALVSSIEMSAQPFKSFRFDGIVGLGLSALAISPAFSWFGVLAQQTAYAPRFGVFLTENENGEDGEDSEIAFGGYNPERLLGPLAWTAVAKAELGYWQVPILAVRIDGDALDLCADGTCRGIVDTGTSHLGVPTSHSKQVTERLTMEAADILDCRLALAPTVEIELPGMNITVPPLTYMRRLPLREGVSVSSGKGVRMYPQQEPPSKSAAAAPDGVQMSTLDTTASATEGSKKSTSNATSGSPALEVARTKRYCRPKTMPVDLPAPLGPKLFILGEPVLHRYYSVYDWSVPQIGFGLAANRFNTENPIDTADRRGSLPDGVDSVLMQKHVRMNFYQGDVSAMETDDIALI